jgi:hypothetical protein
MKKLLILLFMVASVTYGQVNPTFDTVRLKRGGKLYELITYGNPDSVKINGIKFYTSMTGAETDPIWIADSADYYKKAQADNVFAAISHTQSQTTVYGLVDSIAHRIPLHLQTTSTNKDTVIYLHNGTYKTSEMPTYTKYTAYSSGDNNIEVLASGAGVTATIVAGELTFTIPTGVLIQSAKVRVASLSSITVVTGSQYTAMSNRWMPVVQAWREDTGAQLTGMSTKMDLANFNKLSVNGLINTTICQVRIIF